MVLIRFQKLVNIWGLEEFTEMYEIADMILEYADTFAALTYNYVVEVGHKRLYIGC